ncbi:MAG: NapC/NirT family cytochrome c [Candidatus Aminicenantales bacterium]
MPADEETVANSPQTEKPRKKSRKKRRLIALGGVVFVLLLFAGAAEYTSHSKFCSSCHYMKPFYQSWKESRHADIECSACHYPPGIRSFFRVKLEGLNQVLRYWTKLYVKSKPWAEIPDESCLRQGCHDKRLLEGRVQFQRVVFDHKIHLGDLRRGKTLRCTSCHSQIVQGDHIIVTESSCFICHFKASKHYPDIAACSHCHVREDLSSDTVRFNHTMAYEKDFSCDKCHHQIILGDGAVPRENCYKCHFEQDRLDQYDDTDLMHATHIASHKIECNQCHLEIQHKIVKDIETIADCQSCHTGFHQAQKILYTGEGGKGVPHAAPNVMLEKGLSCKGCHMFHEEAGGKLIKSDTLVSREKACESCHGEGFGRLLRNWQASTEKKLGEIRAVHSRAAQETAVSRSAEKTRAQDLLEEAAFNIDVVEKGKAVHNITYSQELLLAAFGRIEEALALVGSSYRPAKFLIETAAAPGECSQCHAGIEEIDAEIFGMSFPHKTHVVGRKMECDLCHSNARRHGELTSSKKSCAVCHHGDATKDCGRCHIVQRALYEGGAFDVWDVPKDIMAEAGAECEACHEHRDGRVSRSDASGCVNCHEESYKETFLEWQTTYRELRNNLEAALAAKKKEGLNREGRARLAGIERSIQKLDQDGSSGIHNSQFVQDILTKLAREIQSIS